MSEHHFDRVEPQPPPKKKTKPEHSTWNRGPYAVGPVDVPR
jgi:hypothetical protein